jgi:outer membrane receptor for ferrienterochelin and colicin
VLAQAARAQPDTASPLAPVPTDAEVRELDSPEARDAGVPDLGNREAAADETDALVPQPVVEDTSAQQEELAQEEQSGASVEHEVANMLSAIKGKDLSELDLEALLENVVVTATKSEIAEDQAPAITTVISREEIQRWGYQSVDEVLHHVAGVYVVNDHIIPNLAVRGISGGLRSESGLVKVMIDGHSVAFRSTAGHWLGPELVPLSAVQQIEIIRGPASSLYGADAFLGVINVVTRRPERMQGGEIALVGHHQG